MSITKLTANFKTNMTINNDCKEECTICGDNLSNENITTLQCGHKYHTDCIIHWFKSLGTLSKTSYKNYSKPRQCPYCRKDGGWLTLKEDEKPIKGIHKEYEIHAKKLTVCGAPYSTKKGNCTNRALSCYGGYCGIHKKWHYINPKNI